MGTTKIKAALYIRVSTEEQALEGQSVDAQIETLSQYCKLYDIDIYDIYKDLGVSGKSFRNRPGLQLMLKDASIGKFNMVLVWKISRLSRSLKDLLLILDQLEKSNVMFTSYSEKFDTSNAVGRMTMQLLGSIAEFERNTIIENVKLGLHEYARKGGKTGTILGYDNINKKLVVNRQEAEIVALIYKLYVINRMSMGDIAEFLKVEGYTTKRGKSFRKDGISVILSNPAYIGINRHNIGTGKEYETTGTHQPIIDRAIWEAAQELRQANKNKRPAKGEEVSYILTNKLICKCCGNSMAGFSTGASRVYRYYKCKSCKKLVNATRIEEIVLDTLYKLLKNKQIVQDVLHLINSYSSNGHQDEQLQQIQNKIKNYGSQLDKYVALLSIEELKCSDIIIEKIKYNEEKLRQLQNIKEKLVLKNNDNKNIITGIEYENIIDSIFQNRDRKALKQIMDRTIKSIEIDKVNGQGYINFSFNEGSKLFFFVL